MNARLLAPLFCTACAVTGHDVRPTDLGATRSSNDLLQVLDHGDGDGVLRAEVGRGDGRLGVLDITADVARWLDIDVDVSDEEARLVSQHRGAVHDADVCELPKRDVGARPTAKLMPSTDFAGLPARSMLSRRCSARQRTAHRWVRSTERS